MTDLTPDQHAAVTEMLNIAIGRAAAALNDLVDEEVTLSVPQVVFVDRHDAGRMIDDRAGAGACAVIQQFDGHFSGNALLIFPEEKSLSLVRLMLGESVPLENMTELEQEALTEVGNIVLNASIGTLANLLGMEITGSLPSYLRGTGAVILGRAGSSEPTEKVLLVEVDFDLEGSNISGYVLFMLDVASARKFGEMIDAYLAQFMSRTV